MASFHFKKIIGSKESNPKPLGLEPAVLTTWSPLQLCAPPYGMSTKTSFSVLFFVGVVFSSPNSCFKSWMSWIFFQMISRNEKKREKIWTLQNLQKTSLRKFKFQSWTRFCQRLFFKNVEIFAYCDFYFTHWLRPNL